eukprot:Phypoly_transcript_17195.p1 GENE.Phypoly_transcript_17195~~Phypoly_transcript_17195.p1  ORF type:complete len:138 (-),score=9.64 Phypoly_transcript_17195:235-648(-)
MCCIPLKNSLSLALSTKRSTESSPSIGSSKICGASAIFLVDCAITEKRDCPSANSTSVFPITREAPKKNSWYWYVLNPWLRDPAIFLILNSNDSPCCNFCRVFPSHNEKAILLKERLLLKEHAKSSSLTKTCPLLIN